MDVSESWRGSDGAKLALAAVLAVFFVLAFGGGVSASPGVVSTSQDGMAAIGDGGGVDASIQANHDRDPDPVARCTVSETSVQVGERVTLDASGSENVANFQYDKFGGSSFSDYTSQTSQTVSYGEAGTYDPRVRVWNYADGEENDVGTCGTITVTDVTPTPMPTPEPSPVARCTVSETSVQVGESVTLDASGSENVHDFQYDKFGGSSFGDYTSQASQTVSYGEPGTYDPRVKVWNYADGEETDVVNCGTISVAELTPTPMSTPEPSPVARCTISDTSVQVGESVTLDASGSENVHDFQYDKFGSSFGQFTNRESRTVAYGEAGTYDPRVKVWRYGGGEETDVATCGKIRVTATTATATPETATETTTATPQKTHTQAPSTWVTAESTADADQTLPSGDTSSSGNRDGNAGTASPTGPWFEYSPAEPLTAESLDLRVDTFDGRDDVAAYRWDVDGDGTTDGSGRTMTVPVSTVGETTDVTLFVDWENGSTDAISRDVPVDLSLSQGESGQDGGGISPLVIAGVGLLVVIVVGLLAVAVLGRQSGDSD